ncbi:Protein MNN4 [[Candida] zeylanoides]
MLFFTRRGRKVSLLVVAVLLVGLVVLLSDYLGSIPKMISLGIYNETWFVREVNKLVARIAAEGDARQQYALDAQAHIASTVQLPHHLADPQHSPHVQPFDARFTFGLVIQDLVRQRAASVDLQIPVFHWADWTDLSALDKYFFSPERQTCQEVFKVRPGKREQEVLDPESYCIDEAAVAAIIEDMATDEALRASLRHVQRQPHSPNFHVYSQGGRSTQHRKTLHSKSYLNDFMPAPAHVVWLLGEGDVRAVTVGVAPGLEQRQRLIDSPLAQGQIDAQQQIRAFAAATADDAAAAPDAPPRLDLHPDLFEDQSLQILRELGESEYKRSLEYSVSDAEAHKYFYEAKLLKLERHWALGAHYDWRFFSGLITTQERQKPVLHGLMHAWLAFTRAHRLHTWVAHGSLLSWYWNGLLFPWDNDIDVQMPIADLHRLARRFNQSVVVDLGGSPVRYGRYFLDCGTYISRRDRGNGLNNIDARFIDIDTGAYIDVTALALSESQAPARYHVDGNFALQTERNRAGQIYNCRNYHFSSLAEVSPLRRTAIEGVEAYVVNDYEAVLRAEYSDMAITKKRYKTATFVPRLGIYVSVQQLEGWATERDADRLRADHPVGLQGKDERDHDPYHLWRDDDWLAFLQSHPEVLEEYYLTRELTETHAAELRFIESGRPTDALRRQCAPLRHDAWSYEQVRGGVSFEQRVQEASARARAPPAGAKVEAKAEATKPVAETQETAHVKLNLPPLRTSTAA